MVIKVLLSAYNDVVEIELNIETKDNYAKVNIKATNDNVNRIWIEFQLKKKNLFGAVGNRCLISI